MIGVAIVSEKAVMYPPPRAYCGPPGGNLAARDGAASWSSSCAAGGLQTIIFLIVAIGMNIRMAFVGKDWKP